VKAACSKESLTAILSDRIDEWKAEKLEATRAYAAMLTI